jgi:hypothetical protein
MWRAVRTSASRRMQHWSGQILETSLAYAAVAEALNLLRLNSTEYWFSNSSPLPFTSNHGICINQPR